LEAAIFCFGTDFNHVFLSSSSAHYHPPPPLQHLSLLLVVFFSFWLRFNFKALGESSKASSSGTKMNMRDAAKAIGGKGDAGGGADYSSAR
jgi:hypothetical protein